MLENDGYMCGISWLLGTLCIKIGGGGAEKGMSILHDCTIEGRSTLNQDNPQKRDLEYPSNQSGPDPTMLLFFYKNLQLNKVLQLNTFIIHIFQYIKGHTISQLGATTQFSLQKLVFILILGRVM